MTRKEQIEREAKSQNHRHFTYGDSDVHSFIEGAQWADATMIELVCDWLIENACNYLICGDGRDEYYLDDEQMAHDLRQEILK